MSFLLSYSRRVGVASVSRGIHDGLRFLSFVMLCLGLRRAGSPSTSRSVRSECRPGGLVRTTPRAGFAGPLGLPPTLKIPQSGGAVVAGRALLQTLT